MQISNARDSFLERMFDQQLEKTGGEKPEKLKPYFFLFLFYLEETKCMNNCRKESSLTDDNRHIWL